MHKKILFVIGQLTHGGAEKQLLLLAEKINKNLFNFNVICLSENAHPYGNLLASQVFLLYTLKEAQDLILKEFFHLQFFSIE